MHVAKPLRFGGVVESDYIVRVEDFDHNLSWKTGYGWCHCRAYLWPAASTGWFFHPGRLLAAAHNPTKLLAEKPPSVYS